MCQYRVMRVLICDDEPLIAESIAEHLTHCGFVTTTFHSALDMLAALSRGGSDVGMIITDLVMPDRDGLRLAAVVRRQYGIPVVLISSRIVPIMAKEDLKQWGLIAILKKPLRLLEVERIVRDTLTRRSREVV